MSRAVPVNRATTGDNSVDRALEALTANVNRMTGQEKNAAHLTKLDPATATLAQAVALLNQVVDRLQGT